MGGGSRGGQSCIEGAEKVEINQEKRVPPPKKEEDARAAIERSAEIQARCGVADKARKENDGVWPACEK